MRKIVKFLSMLIAFLLLLSNAGQYVTYSADTDRFEAEEALINEDTNEDPPEELSPEETLAEEGEALINEYASAELPPEAPLAGASNTPVIALSRIPDLGKAEPFEGYVYMGDGSALTPEDYHVTLYLQVSYEHYNAYYVKPSATQPFVSIDEDGYFNVNGRKPAFLTPLLFCVTLSSNKFLEVRNDKYRKTEPQ